MQYHSNSKALFLEFDIMSKYRSILFREGQESMVREKPLYKIDDRGGEENFRTDGNTPRK